MVCGICHFPSAPEDCEIFLSAILFCTLGKTTGIHILRFTPICFQNLSGVPGFSGKLWEFVFSVCSQFVGCVVFGDDRLEFRKFGCVCVSGSPKYRLYIPGTDMLFFWRWWLPEISKFHGVCSRFSGIHGGRHFGDSATHQNPSLSPTKTRHLLFLLSHLLLSLSHTHTCFSLPVSLSLAFLFLSLSRFTLFLSQYVILCVWCHGQLTIQNGFWRCSNGPLQLQQSSSSSSPQTQEQLRHCTHIRYLSLSLSLSLSLFLSFLILYAHSCTCFALFYLLIITFCFRSCTCPFSFQSQNPLGVFPLLFFYTFW